MLSPSNVTSFEKEERTLSLDYKILLIHNNIDKCTSFTNILQKYWEIKIVSNYNDAYELVKKNIKIDIIIADLKIFDCSQSVFDLKKITDGVPIIILTDAESESRIKKIQSYIDDLLLQPFSELELITRIRTQMELRRQRRILLDELNTMTRLHKIATDSMQDGSIYSVLLETIDAAISITHADKGTIQFFDEKSGVLELVASRGFSQPFLDHFAECPYGKGSSGTALKSNERVIVEDIKKSSIFVGTPDLEPLLIEGIRAVQTTILKSRSGKLLGMLTTHYRTTYTPQYRDLQRLDLISRLLADIIEKEQWMQERARLIDMLHEEDRRKNIFLSTLSHELRNPLTSLSNCCFLLAHSALEQDSIERTRATMDRQLKKMIRITDDLLDITSITQNKIQFQKQLIDINELVFRSIEDNYSLFESLEIKINTIFFYKPLLVNVDPIRITQAIGNVLHNAAKFSLPGQTIQVLLHLDKQKNQAVIVVSDDGVGIEADLIEHLFKPFMQADRSLDRTKGGLGLGLVLVDEFVKLHGGEVSIVSEGLNKGTKFTIRLPLDESINILGSSVLKIDSHDPVSLHHRSILIIDDNLSVIESLSMVLKTFGYVVHTSNNSFDGIQKARQLQPDFILCDIGLPTINGYEVATILKSDINLNKSYLIALSGYAQPTDIEKSSAAGFDLHLAKPPDLEMLKEILSKN